MHDGNSTVHVSTTPSKVAAVEGTIGAKATIIKKRKVQELSNGSALYLFAGPKRKSSISAMLRKSNWFVLEIDILQGGSSHDLTRTGVRQKLLDRVAAGEFNLVLTSPPCNTFSRVKFANDWGPRPSRTAKFLRGLPWLPPAVKRQVQLANTLVDFNFELIALHLQNPKAMLILEFPEDLGAVSKGRWKGVRPGSIFQWPQFQEVLRFPGVVTGGIRQSDFGTPYVKPTRLILKLHNQQLRNFFPGIPEFTADGFYSGPIPRSSATSTLAKTHQHENFRTTGTAAWPEQLCSELAMLACQALMEQNTLDNDVLVRGSGIRPVDQGLASESTLNRNYKVVIPPGNFWIGGTGIPRETCSCGKVSPFSDGAGLTSPGRWKKGARRFPEGKRWDDIRTQVEKVLTRDLDECGILKQVAALACGKEIFCWKWVEDIRDAIHTWLGRQCGDYDSTKPPVIPPGQPFYLPMIAALLREARDPDYELFYQLETGVSIGILEPLPHNPACYELQTSWRLQDDPFAVAAMENSNYQSVDKFVSEVEKQFKEEEVLGWMEEMEDVEFSRRYGKNSAISALAVLEEKDKLRVLHDASNVTRVNHRIRCRDRQRMPSIKEKHCLLQEFREEGVIALSVLGDASKAHRRIKIRPDEFGFLGCRLRPNRVWINKVGTFGVSSASYWWGRAAGGILRAVYSILGGANSLDILLFADDCELISTTRRERLSVLLAVALLLSFGFPFKWAKFRGGFEVEWLGMAVSYKSFSMGLSSSRAQWLAGWIDKILAEGSVLTGEMASGLGRLNYAAQALYYEKAFLGIIYLWTSAVVSSGKFKVDIPWAVRLVLKWIGKRITAMTDGLSGRLQEAPCYGGRRSEWFRSDAKAEGGRAWIGGWEIREGCPVKGSRWFSLEITKEDAPWVYAKGGDPQRVIAALELLGSLLCIMLFDPDAKKTGRSNCMITGSTDNRGNSFIVRKLASTKWPIVALLIELSEQLRARKALLDLQWVPRGENTEADELTNQDYHSFDEADRINVCFKELQWRALPEILQVSGELYNDVCRQREERKSGKAVPMVKRRKGPALGKLKWKDPW